MLVTDDVLLAGRDPVTVARDAVGGGVTAVQLRLKQATARELADLARRLREALPAPVLVLVNDRPDVAAVAGCGVHLGPEDLPLALARRVLPPGAIIGASVGTAAEVEAALAAELESGARADYWGVGPWRVTGTKGDAGAALGVAGFRAVVQRAGGRPCLAIGGVRPEHVPQVLAAGGTGVAVVSGILAEADVAAAARGYAGRLGRRSEGVVGW
jgi:thiamine-phosphate pyrophosphorylase